MSKELFDKIKQAQKLAGEQVVLDGLKAKGLLPESKEPQGDKFRSLITQYCNGDITPDQFIKSVEDEVKKDTGQSTPQEEGEQEELEDEIIDELLTIADDPYRHKHGHDDKLTRDKLKQSFTITRKQ